MSAISPSLRREPASRSSEAKGRRATSRFPFFPCCWRRVLLGFGCSLGLSMVATPVWSAEDIFLFVGPLQFSLEVESLERYAREGKVEADLSPYVGQLTEEQREQFREILEQRADVSPVAIAQFLYTPQGEMVLRELGQLIQTRSGQSGFYAIRSALILAAADPKGLTPLNVLKQFPTSSIRINSTRAFELLGRVTGLVRETEEAIAILQQQALAQAAANPGDFPLDLQQAGNIPFTETRLELNDFSRNRRFPADLYLPQTGGRKPLIVISHGFGSNRQSYRYLALHLASHGFAVAVPEHPGSNADQLEALASGLVKGIAPPRELLDRPLDIQFLLDELQARYPQQIDWQRVGALGQSFGGYTVLTLAGAQIDTEELEADCAPRNTDFNISFLIQCQALQLPQTSYNFRDPRIAAAIAINPLNSKIFGPQQLAPIEIPLMLVSSGDDSVTPALEEQFLPFTTLTGSEKYLTLLDQGTHFSTIGATGDDFDLPPQVRGPDPAIAYGYTKALALAFFQTYIAGNEQYRAYLSPAYAQSISRWEMPLSLVESLDVEELRSQSN